MSDLERLASGHVPVTEMAGMGPVPMGSSVCPICGLDTPHYHSPEVVSEYYNKVNSGSMKQIKGVMGAAQEICKLTIDHEWPFPDVIADIIAKHLWPAFIEQFRAHELRKDYHPIDTSKKYPTDITHQGPAESPPSSVQAEAGRELTPDERDVMHNALRDSVEIVSPPSSVQAEAVGELRSHEGRVSFHTLMPPEKLPLGLVYTHPAPVSKEPGEAPIDMLLYCPKCNRQHVDGPQPHEGWTNPPHRSHKCRFPDCGHVWRPADVATNGVAALDTSGELDGSPNPKDFTSAPLPEARGAEETDLARKILMRLDGYNLEDTDKEMIRFLCWKHMQHSTGWVMVPREPTEAMLRAMDDGFHGDLYHVRRRRTYAQVLAAAPSPKGEK